MSEAKNGRGFVGLVGGGDDQTQAMAGRNMPRVGDHRKPVSNLLSDRNRAGSAAIRNWRAEHAPFLVDAPEGRAIARKVVRDALARPSVPLTRSGPATPIPRQRGGAANPLFALRDGDVLGSAVADPQAARQVMAATVGGSEQ